jgi:hypothetical protein
MNGVREKHKHLDQKMKAKYTKNNHLKITYEEFLGSETSISTWYRIKQSMRTVGLEINHDNLKIVASMKLLFEDSKLPLEQILQAYLEATSIYKDKVFLGKDLFKKLKEIAGNRCSEVTIIRWFFDVPKDSHGFRFNQKRQYKGVEIYQVFIRAISYKKRYEGKAKTINYLSKQIAS